MSIHSIRVIVSSVFLTFSALTQVASAASLEGVIKGAECHFYGKFCSQEANDAKPSLEKDFVLVAGDDYFLLDNLPYEEKLKLNDKHVKIQGNEDGGPHVLWVDNVKVKKGYGYQIVWDWDEIDRELYDN